MNNKSYIYKRILTDGVIYLRNCLCLNIKEFKKKKYHEKCKYIAELLHNIPALLDDEEIGDGDIYFLNKGVSYLLEIYPDKEDGIFIAIARSLEELTELVNEVADSGIVFPESIKKLL